MLFAKHLKKPEIIRQALLNAGVAAIYIFGIALILSNGEKIFGEMNGPVGVVAFLLLFVLSAAVMGVSLFGKALLWYLDGKKSEAVLLVAHTLLLLFLVTVIVLAILIIA